VATTYRKATAIPRAEAPFRSTAESPKYANANRIARQGRLASRAADRLQTVVPLIAAIAEASASLRARSHGSTVSVFDGNLLGRPCFAVSPHPERSLKLAEAPTRDMLFAFALLNVDLLFQPHYALGTWFDSRRSRHVLDVVLCLGSLKDAVRIGRDRGQQAIFDLRNTKEISLVPVHEATSIEFHRKEN
jgi:hypothetical protein